MDCLAAVIAIVMTLVAARLMRANVFAHVDERSAGGTLKKPLGAAFRRSVMHRNIDLEPDKGRITFMNHARRSQSLGASATRGQVFNYRKGSSVRHSSTIQ